MNGDRSFVVADVPGLIEGAHEGHGLGDRFLKHLDRTKVLVHLVDVSGGSGRDPVEDFEAVQRELSLFSPELGAKPQVVAATKVDALSEREPVDRLKAHVESLGLPFIQISAVSGHGIDPLLEMMWRHLRAGAPSTGSGSPRAASGDDPEHAEAVRIGKAAH
jgi:GTP-binding protein